jgi:ABC-2 type transport system ATP-binding protein
VGGAAVTGRGLFELRSVVVDRGARFRLAIPWWSLRPGVTVVTGPNGSGKSTLLDLVATVVRPTSGDVTIDGTPLWSQDQALSTWRRHLGYLPQEDSCPPRVRAFDHVDLVAVAREIGEDVVGRRGAVAEALSATDSIADAGLRCGDLSGGQRRRVALAAALVGSPGLLVLDEPDASLDDQHRQRLRDLVRRAPVTLLATHDHHLADHIADHRVHLDGGTLHEL